MNRPFLPEEETVYYKGIYSRWRRRIVLTFTGGWLAVTLVELLLGYVITRYVQQSFDLLYIARYVLLPFSIDGLAILLTNMTLQREDVSDAHKNYLVIGMMALIGTVLTAVHSYFLIMPACFLVVIAITAAFADKRLTAFSAALSFAGLLISFLLTPLFDQTWETPVRLLTLAVVSVFIAILTFILFLIADIHRQRESILGRMRKDNDVLRTLARHDGLTGLLNHSSFHEDLSAALKAALPFSVVMIDIDDFKHFNDTYGHSTGDEVLRLAAFFLQDAFDADSVYRYGGDELAVISHGGLSPEDVYTRIENVRSRISQERLSSVRERLSLSAGIFDVTDFSLSEDEVFHRADRALYTAKQSGKSRCVRV